MNKLACSKCGHTKFNNLDSTYNCTICWNPIIIPHNIKWSMNGQVYVCINCGEVNFNKDDILKKECYIYPLLKASKYPLVVNNTNNASATVRLKFGIFKEWLEHYKINYSDKIIID